MKIRRIVLLDGTELSPTEDFWDWELIDDSLVYVSVSQFADKVGLYGRSVLYVVGEE